MNTVYRNGTIWIAHCVPQDSRAAINWYKIQAAAAALLDQGMVTDPVMSFFMPSITVESANNNVLISFSASTRACSPGTAGRSGSDPPARSPPHRVQNGAAAYNQSSSGVNRWGDYSVTSGRP